MFEIELIFESLDGLKLHRRPNGSFLVKNKKELFSIVGCIMIDQHSSNLDDQEVATKLLERLKNNKIYSIETGELILERW